MKNKVKLGCNKDWPEKYGPKVKNYGRKVKKRRPKCNTEKSKNLANFKLVRKIENHVDLP